jgi:chorismate mutase-like protein
MMPAANPVRPIRGCEVRLRRAGYHGSGTHQFERAIRRYARRDGRGEATSMEISDWRKKIDELDEQIVQLISKRAEAAKAIGELKKVSSLPVYEPNREQAVFDHIRAVNPGPLSGTEMQDIYERIIDVMRTLQRREG